MGWPFHRASGPKKGALPGTVIALGLTSFFTDVGSEMIFPLLPLFLASLGATPAFLGLVEGVADATASLLKLWAGHVSDRLKRKKPLVLMGYGLAAVVRPLVAFAGAPVHVLLVRLTDRVGKGIRSAPRDALIAGAVPSKEAGRAFGFHRAMDHAGAVVGPLLATLLLSLGWSLRDVFLVTLIPGLLSFGCVLAAREPKEETPPAAQQEGGAQSGERLPPVLRSYLAILGLFSLANSSDAFLLLRAKEVGISSAAIPTLWSVFHVVKLMSAYVGGSWSDRLPRVWVIVAGWGVYALAYLGFGFANQPWQVWTLFLVYGVYYGLTEPAEKALVKDLAPPAMQGRAYGLYHAIIGLSAIPAGLLTGWLWQMAGAQLALLAGAVMAFIAAALLLLLPRPNSN